MPALWLGIKWLGGAVASGIIGEWIAGKIQDEPSTEELLNQQAKGILGFAVAAALIVGIALHSLMTLKKKG